MDEAPGSVEETAALIRRAPGDGLNLVATGAGAHLTTGEAATGDGVVRVGTAAFVGIRDHAAADMTVCVGAGTRLPDLQALLARAGQWLPIDPPKAEETTIGGLLAANLAGPLRTSQGRARDLLLGIRTLDGRGELIKAGGKVVKNVAGYDLPRLHVGAFGGLGLILEATFRIRPRPAVERAWVAQTADAESAMALALALRDAAEPGWLELAGPGVLAADTFSVVAGSLGDAADVESALAAWQAVSASGAPEDDAAALRARLADATAAAEQIVLKAASLPSRVGGLLAAAAKVRDARNGPPTLLAHAAGGVARLLTPSVSHALALIETLRGGLEREGGSLIVERASQPAREALRAQTSLLGTAPATIELMRGVKAAMDPQSVLAVGRLGWGI